MLRIAIAAIVVASAAQAEFFTDPEGWKSTEIPFFSREDEDHLLNRATGLMIGNCPKRDSGGLDCSHYDFNTLAFHFLACTKAFKEVGKIAACHIYVSRKADWWSLQ